MNNVHKLFLAVSLACFSTVTFSEQNNKKNVLEIIDYQSVYANDIMDIAFQDPMKFFVGSCVVTNGLMPADLFESENKKGMMALLDDELFVKKVLIKDKKVIGFVIFHKGKELSLESMERIAKAQGMPFDESQILKYMPHVKKTDAQAESFAQIIAIAVSRAFRNQGYGKMLLHNALISITNLWPELGYVLLDVNDDNQPAKKLYASERFDVNPIQPLHFSFMKAVQYRKSLR